MNIVDLCNFAASLGGWAAAVALLRRPTSRWRAGWAGKTVSVAAALLLAFHFGTLLIPFGAVIAVARHRHDRPDPSAVPLADRYPGA